MRPRQWVKNVLLYASFLFTLNQLWQPFSASMWHYFWLASIGFALFCGLSSGVYLLNDVWDREKDQVHPKKRRRPIAAGHLPVPVAIASACLLIAGSLTGCFVLRPMFGAAASAYLLLQVAYTLWWKKTVILDVFIISFGFVIRAACGAWVIGSWISSWLYIVTFLGALFLGFCKRRHELLLLEGVAANHRENLSEYSAHLLDQMIAIVAATTIMAYSLYTFTAEHLPKNHVMMVTIPHVLYGMFRYLYLVYRRDQGGSPEEVLFRDRPLLFVISLWVLTSALVLATARRWQ